MRGFPLLNTCLVIAIFAIAWWPLQKTVADREPATEEFSLEGIDFTENSSEDDQLPAGISILSTQKIESIRIEHLGEPIFEGRDSTSFEHLTDHLPIPAEGTDLWVEATLSGSTDGQSAIRIQLETSTGDLIERTLWGEGPTIADSLYFTPPVQ